MAKKFYHKPESYYSSYNYYKILYRSNLRNIKKIYPDYSAYSRIYSQEEFNNAVSAQIPLSEIVYGQLHYYRSRDVVKNIQAAARKQGFNFTEYQINNRAFPKEWWEQIKRSGREYRERTGASAREMLEYISYEFYGS